MGKSPLNAKGRDMARELAKLPEVQAAAKEPEVKTTQDHYGHYVAAISALADVMGRPGKEGHVLAAETLRYAGGNGRGINAAMSAMFGYGEYDPVFGSVPVDPVQE